MKNIKKKTSTRKDGITLIAIIITIIVMLILVSVTINLSINGGLFDSAKLAIEETRKADYKKAIQLIQMEKNIESIMENITNKEYMDWCEELLTQVSQEEGRLKDIKVNRQTDEKIQVITKEGYVYIVIKDSVEYIGREEELPAPDLQESDIESTINPSKYTNKDVEVTITTKITGYILQYSLDGEEWKNYKDKIIMTKNGVIYVRLANRFGGVGSYITINVANIDKVAPTISSVTTSASSASITATITASDDASGIGTYYYSIDNGSTYTESTSSSYTFSGLNGETTYNIKVKVKDIVGNETEYSVQVTTSKAVVVGDIVTYKDVEWQVTDITDGTVTMKATAQTGSYYFAGGTTKDEHTDEMVLELNEYCDTLFGETELGISACSVDAYQGWNGVEYWIARGETDAFGAGTGCAQEYKLLLYYVSGENSTVNSESDTFAVWPIATLPIVIIEYVNGSFVVN